MLVSEFVEIPLVGSNIPYYENLGYKIPRRRRSKQRPKTDLTVPTGTRIFVSVLDLPPSSNVIVEVRCDFCGKIIPKEYYKYINQRKNSPSKKDCCYDCRSYKNKETMQLRYGVEWNSQLDLVREKIAKANKEDEQIVEDRFKQAGYIMLDKYESYSNPIRFICQKHKEHGEQITSYCIVKNFNSGCHYCRYEKITGENCHFWKGGVTDISNHLRGKIQEWKYESLKHNNSRCILTGINDGTLVIHHLHSFAEIVKETLKNTGIVLYPEVSMYSEEELNLLEVECLRLHYNNGLGVPIVKSLHKIFHSRAGNLIIDDGEFKEFCDKYRNFEFDYLLEDKYKYKNCVLKGVN